MTVTGTANEPRSEQDIFEKTLERSNRWVELEREIDWERLQEIYSEQMDASILHPSVPSRTLIAAFIVKYKLKLSSNATIRLIDENQYIQYFVKAGKPYGSPPVSADLMRSIRNRFSRADWTEFKKEMLEESFSTLFGNLFFMLRKSLRITYISKFFEPETHAKVPLEFLPGTVEKKARQVVEIKKPRRKKRRKTRKLKKKVKRYLDIVIWVLLITMVSYSLVMIFKEADWLHDKRKIDKKK